jgi:hypothetical protein
VAPGNFRPPSFGNGLSVEDQSILREVYDNRQPDSYCNGYLQDCGDYSLHGFILVVPLPQ